MSSNEVQIPKLYDDIMFIKGGNAAGEYQLRVLRKWSVFNSVFPGNVESVDMVMIDMNGHKIQATIPNLLLCLFDNLIDEGNVYVLSNLSVTYNLHEILGSYNRYMLVFNVNTKVNLSSSSSIAHYGMSLIGSDNVLQLSERFKYLVDVIGVITFIRHNKNYFDDGTISTTVSFKLTDHRNSYDCELCGDYVDLFRVLMENQPLGLPIVVLQFAKITMQQGSIVVQSVDHVTRLYVNPVIHESIQFKTGLILALNQTRRLLGNCPTDKSVGFRFDVSYQFKTISELMDDPQTGIFIVNARIVDMIELNPWWYPVCRCDIIVESYLGAYFCENCHATEFSAVPKYRVKMVLEDETGACFIEAYDHVMLPISLVDPNNPILPEAFFPRAFDSVMGKSIVLILHKTVHIDKFLDPVYEVRCVSDDPQVMNFYASIGLCRIPSKIVPNLIDPECNLMKKKVYRPPVTSTERLLDEYLGPVYRRNPPCDDAESSSAAAGKSRLVRQCSSSLFVLDSLNECEGFHITMEYSIDNISRFSVCSLMFRNDVVIVY
ncbi:unnamed protein product [Trifolium pratense]|uniref:Uncharacterized protein n=1 Tax=Trifolium pratense TaxID=57577 RepID=A0ACB0K9Q3_TRIPR|nr:unnamed protein product [Trifolium pratense]